jgi:hypothetical protein
MGTATINSVFFRPILSITGIESRGPIAAPTLTKEVIQDSSNGVIGLPNGLSSMFSTAFSFGKTGEVHEYAAPAIMDARLAVKREFPHKVNLVFSTHQTKPSRAKTSSFFCASWMIIKNYCATCLLSLLSDREILIKLKCKK